MGKLNRQSQNATKKRTRTNYDKRTRARYTEEQKISAVTAMLQVGTTGHLSYEAQAAARMVLGANVSTTTLATWLKNYQAIIEAADTSLIPKPIDLPHEIVTTREAVIRNLNSTVTKISNRLTDDQVINEAKLRDLAVTMGISVEKIMLLSGIDPELTSLVQALAHECEGTHWHPAALIEDVIKAVRNDKLSSYPSIDVLPSGS